MCAKPRNLERKGGVVQRKRAEQVDRTDEMREKESAKKDSWEETKVKLIWGENPRPLPFTLGSLIFLLGPQIRQVVRPTKEYPLCLNLYLNKSNPQIDEK